MIDAAVYVEGLRKNFDSLEALKGIDFEVPTQSIFGLLGPNGAGKTTAIRILSTILHPDGGKAEVMGFDVVHQAKDVRYQIGLAGQNAAVDPNLTGYENLDMVGRLAQVPKKESRLRANDLLERFGLAESANRPLRTYSGGMRRRLDVAAALVARPPVLFLDEPTTGLDIQSRAELWEVIRELVGQGSTVLLTTQYLEEADRLADRIAVIDHGLVVANDTAKALKTRLGNTTIEIEMENPEDGTRAQQLVSGFCTDHPERRGNTVHLTCNQGPLVLVEALRALEAESLIPTNISVREPTLDEVFLELTGARPGDPVDNESIAGGVE